MTSTSNHYPISLGKDCKMCLFFKKIGITERSAQNVTFVWCDRLVFLFILEYKGNVAEVGNFVLIVN